MNNIDKQYQALLQDILDNGVKKEDRTGTGTISVFGRQIKHKMSEGFPLLTTKKMPFKTIVTELLWFLRGDTNIKYLVDNNCHIWDGDAYKNYRNNLKADHGDGPDLMTRYIYSLNYNYNFQYLTQEEFINKIKTDDEFAKKWGELGPIYGKQWSKWRNKISANGEYMPFGNNIDQIQNLINDLKTNPDSRRLMVSAWNVGELDQMVLPPCHYGFQVYTRELSEDERIKIYRDRVANWRKQGSDISENWDKMNDEEVINFLNADKIAANPTRAISLMWNQRSVDTFLGLPFNIASYGLLLEILAEEVNMVPDELIGNLGDVHLYSNHIDAAKEQIGRELTFEEKIQWVMRNTDVELENFYITEAAASLSKRTREPFPLPTFDCPAIDEIPHTTFDELVFKLQPCDFYMDDYQSHPTIKAPLSN